MSKITWRGGALIAPLPVVLVSSGTLDKPNVMTAAWTGIINTIPAKTYVAIRPEGFNVDPNGPFSATMKSIEVMGRDSSIVSTHPAAETPIIRSIIASDTCVEKDPQGKVHFTIKPHKMFVFNKETEERIYVDEHTDESTQDIR
jgi:hypothetical protein